MTRTISTHCLTLLSLLLLLSHHLSSAQQPGDEVDKLSDCPQRAQRGECDRNFKFMRQNCHQSCMQHVKSLKNYPQYNIRHDTGKNFFDLKAEDYNGKKMSFEDFEGYVTLVVNMESDCDILNNLRSLSHLQDTFPYGLEILIFPTPKQQPQTVDDDDSTCPSVDITTCPAVQTYSKTLGNGNKIVIMKESDINDPDHIVYRYFREKFKMEDEPFANDKSTFILVDPDGNLELHTDVSLVLLTGVIHKHMREDL